VLGDAARKDRAFRIATDFLGNLAEETSDFDPEKSVFKYLKIVNGRLTIADSQNDAQFTRLDLMQKNIDNDYGIYYPGLTESTMYFIFRSEGSPRMVDASFAHFIQDLEVSSTYPIKTPLEAYQDLEDGNAYVFNENEGSDPVDITDVKLGYYAGAENQQYLLPIYVFEGKNFTGYVQAITNSSIGN
jgi:hypothetical protein